MVVFMSLWSYVLLSLCSGKADDELLAEVDSLMSKERLLYWSKVPSYLRC